MDPAMQEALDRAQNEIFWPAMGIVLGLGLLAMLFLLAVNGLLAPAARGLVAWAFGPRVSRTAMNAGRGRRRVTRSRRRKP